MAYGSKIFKHFGKKLRIVRVNLTSFLAFSLASVSFGNGLKGLLHKRHNAHESTGDGYEKFRCVDLTNIICFIWTLKKVTLKY